MIFKIPSRIEYMTADIQEGDSFFCYINGHNIEFKYEDGKLLYFDPDERYRHPNKKYGYWREWEKWKGWCR